MAQFGYDELGKRAKDLGFAGIDLTVRPKGHVLPDRAAEDLPKAFEAIRRHGLAVPMIATDIKSAADPTAETILSKAGALKIPFWKVGYHSYTGDDVEGAIRNIHTAVEGLVGLSKKHGVTAGWHNHSGNYFGAAVWDTRAVIHDQDPKAIGYYFDPGHATIEGGLAGWRIAQNMVMPRLKMVALKDFYWEKGADGKWKTRWCPMGQGMVDWNRVFAGFAAAKFAGPYSLHLEYEARDELAAMAKDLEVVKKQIDIAYA
jgi:sugar phosphate isomerase/epimerase